MSVSHGFSTRGAASSKRLSAGLRTPRQTRIRGGDDPVRRSHVIACCLAITVGSGLAAFECRDVRAQAPSFSWTHVGTEQLTLEESGQPVLTFQLESKSLDGKFPRANYVHPLFDPDGIEVTEDFPKDHPHHRGIFWAWHQLLWNGKRVADPWICQGIEWKIPKRSGAWLTTRASDRSASMRVVRDWTVAHPDHPDQSLRLVRSTVCLTAYAKNEGRRMLDFDVRLHPLVPGVTLGGSEDVKGYGGFSTRIRLAADTGFSGQIGEVKPKPMAAVPGGGWVDVVRTLDGRPRGVAIMVHPSHPGYPLKWILRPKGSAQNPEWPGREPIALRTGQDLRLRYRLVLHTGPMSSESLESIWQQFAQRP